MWDGWMQFLFGMAGALIAVYYVRRDAIPGFPLFSSALDRVEDELSELRRKLLQTEGDINRVEARLESGAPPPGPHEVERLRIYLEHSKGEREDIRSRTKLVEERRDRAVFLSRLAGFVAYIVIGGFFGWGAQELIEIQVLPEGGVSNSFEAAFFGATWTSYLSAVGLSGARERVIRTLTNLESRTRGGLSTSEVKGDLPPESEWMIQELDLAKSQARRAL